MTNKLVLEGPVNELLNKMCCVSKATVVSQVCYAIQHNIVAYVWINMLLVYKRVVQHSNTNVDL